jgi:acyl dehydratase
MVNRDMLGKPLPPTTYEVERNKIREFANAIGDTNPIYQDVEAARAAGYPDLPIPPTFPTTFGFWGRMAKDAGRVDLGIPMGRVLHGSEEYTYVAPIHAGDTITGVRTMLDAQEKTGNSGKMEIVTTETVYTNQHGQVVLKTRAGIVIRL